MADENGVWGKSTWRGSMTMTMTNGIAHQESKTTLYLTAPNNMNILRKYYILEYIKQKLTNPQL